MIRWKFKCPLCGKEYARTFDRRTFEDEVHAHLMIDHKAELEKMVRERRSGQLPGRVKLQVRDEVKRKGLVIGSLDDIGPDVIPKKK